MLKFKPDSQNVTSLTPFNSKTYVFDWILTIDKHIESQDVSVLIS